MEKIVKSVKIQIERIRRDMSQMGKHLSWLESDLLYLEIEIEKTEEK